MPPLIAALAVPKANEVKVRLARSGYIVDAGDDGGGPIVYVGDQRVQLTANWVRISAPATSLGLRMDARNRRKSWTTGWVPSARLDVMMSPSSVMFRVMG